MLWNHVAVLAWTNLVGALLLGIANSAAAAEQATVAEGQRLIDAGRYDKAVRVFTSVIDADPTGIEGYRGRIEALVLLGRYADAVGDYTRVTARVLPVHPDAASVIFAGYAQRLAASPTNIPALIGAAFAHWWYFDYRRAIDLIDTYVALRPNDLFGRLFSGSSRLLSGTEFDRGAADLETAIALAPTNPHVRFIVADAYTYGAPDPQRAFDEASLAQQLGLNTPRILAILAASHNAFGDVELAAFYIDQHIERVTTETLTTAPLAEGRWMDLEFVPGRTYEIPLPAKAGDPISLSTHSNEIWDSILVLLAPDGTPIVGSDDFWKYFAGLDEWTPDQTGTYRLLVTTFESVSTGEMKVTRH